MAILQNDRLKELCKKELLTLPTEVTEHFGNQLEGILEDTLKIKKSTQESQSQRIIEGVKLLYQEYQKDPSSVNGIKKVLKIADNEGHYLIAMTDQTYWMVATAPSVSNIKRLYPLKSVENGGEGTKTQYSLTQLFDPSGAVERQWLEVTGYVGEERKVAVRRTVEKDEQGSVRWDWLSCAEGVNSYPWTWLPNEGDSEQEKSADAILGIQDGRVLRESDLSAVLDFLQARKAILMRAMKKKEEMLALNSVYDQTKFMISLDENGMAFNVELGAWCASEGSEKQLHQECARYEQQQLHKSLESVHTEGESERATKRKL